MSMCNFPKRLSQIFFHELILVYTLSFFQLTVRDVLFNKTSYYELPSKKTMNQTHTIESHWGGKYLITVQNSQPDARPTPPVVINGPMIPPPYELTYNPSDNSFFWKRSRNFPQEMANQT